MNKVAIVVLNWNGIEDTLACVDSLLKQSYPEFKIIVVDNGSKDDSVKILREFQKAHADTIEVLCNETNLGFDGGANTGIRYALEHQYDAVALFNNDAVADKEWLAHLVRAFDDPRVGMSTGLLLHEDGKTVDSTGEFYSKWGLPFPRNRGDNTVFAPDSEFVFGASGGATLYRTSLFKGIGIFDEDFFAYYEDADISFRAQLAGYKVRYSADAIAYHKQGATSGKMPGFTVRQTFKNLPWVYIKNVPRGLHLYIGPRFILAYTLMLGKAILHGSGGSAITGFIQSLARIPKKIGERRHIQASKKVTIGYIRGMLWDDLPPDQTGLRKLRDAFLKFKS